MCSGPFFVSRVSTCVYDLRLTNTTDSIKYKIIMFELLGDEEQNQQHINLSQPYRFDHLTFVETTLTFVPEYQI